MFVNPAAVAVVLIDLVGSTAAVTERGMRQVGPEVADRLHELVEEFKAADSTVCQVGEFAFDGVLLVGSNPSKAIRCAVRAQSVYAGLSARIAVAVGPVEMVDGAGAQGAVINLADRLLSTCHPGGVVLSEAAMEYTFDYPALRRRLVRRHSVMKGFGTIWCWTLDARRRADEGLRRIVWAMAVIQMAMVVVLVLLVIAHLRLPEQSATLFEYGLPRVFADEAGLQPTSTFVPGATAWVRRLYCATERGRVVIHRFLLDGTAHEYEEREYVVNKGCQASTFKVVLPATMTPGIWTYRVVAGFPGSDLRTLTDVFLTIKEK